MDTAVRDVLVGMKTALSKGWIQGEAITREGVCLYGALIQGACLHPYREVPPGTNSVAGRDKEPSNQEPGTYAATYRIYSGTPADEAIQLISAEVGVEPNSLALWNDEDGRSVDDIVGVIDRILLRDSEKPVKKNARKREQRKLAIA